MKKIVLPGGTGFLGRSLAGFFGERGWEVVVLSRTGRSCERGRCVEWDGETLGEWAREIEGAEAVVNLAGRTVNCRYDARNRRDICESRLRSTRVLGEAIAKAAQPPRVWINSSSATIYRDARDRAMDEATGEIGSGFSVDVCEQWERELANALALQTRKVALRTAIVLGPGAGGAFSPFFNVVRFGGGGKMGDGGQYVSWIHVEDFCRAVEWVLEHEELTGAVNCTAPNPVPNAEFMRELRQACGRRIGLPASRWMLEIGAFALRTETELLLKSRRVVPARLLASGFEFRFPELHAALSDLVPRHRAARATPARLAA